MESRDSPGPWAALGAGAVTGGDLDTPGTAWFDGGISELQMESCPCCAWCWRERAKPARDVTSTKGQNRQDKASCGGQEKPHFPAFFSTAVFVASLEVNPIQVWTENPTQLNFGGADISLFSQLTKG